MTSRSPIVVPKLDHAPELPRYRYYGEEKPPAALTAMAQASPRVSVDKGTATIRMYGPIDPWGGFWGISAKEVAEALDGLDADVKKIQLRVNCPGGAAWEGLAILNLLRAHHAEVEAIVDGLAASAASFIVAGMDERVMSPGTMMMIHKAWASAWGCNADEMRKVAGVLDKLDESMADLYTEAAGRTSAEWLTDMAETTWYTALDAKTAGLVDRVEVVPDAGATSTVGDDDEDESGDDEEMAASFDLSMYDHAPAASWPASPAAASAAPKPPPAPADGSVTPTQEGSPAVAFSDEQVTSMRQKLGVKADADEATILAALDEVLAEQPESEKSDAPTKTTVPEGMALVDSEVLAELRAGAQAGRTANTKLEDQERDSAIQAAVRAGKIPKSRVEHYATAWKADPEGTKALLDSLEAGLIPVDEEKGSADDPDASAGDIALTDAELDAFAAQVGLSKEALRG